MMASTAEAIAVTDLVKDYGGTGLLGASLTIPDRGVTAIIGPNGAGKTTLFTVVTGLVRPDSGNISIAPAIGDVAYCPDTPAFERWLTASEVLNQSASLARRRSRQTNADLLARCGLDDAATRRVGGFSRGMTQRLGIAATLVTDPRLMILDEPTSALDPLGRLEVLALLRDLGQERGVVLSSHSLADVEKIADVVIILVKGRVVYQGTLAELLSRQERPVWRVRTRNRANDLTATLAVAPAVSGVTASSPDELIVAMRSMDEGERELPALLVASGIPIVEMTLDRPDLDEAFAAIVSGEPAR
ncbi:MAG: ABC transporter ATP-binding protein [Thermomicrobiales bacterium]